jgi:hypothetical protein
MATIKVVLVSGKKTLNLEFRQPNFSIGKKGTLLVPLPWIRDEHLVVDNSGGFVRVRCGDGARATLDGMNIGKEWVTLPADSTLVLPGPNNKQISLRFTYTPAGAAAVLLKHDQPLHVEDDPELAQPPLATASPLDQQGWNTICGPQQSTSAPSTPPAACADRQPRRRSRLPKIAVALLFLLLAGAMAASIVNVKLRSAEAARVASDKHWIEEQFTKAQSLLDQKQYSAAKAALESIEPVARKYPDCGGTLAYAANLLKTPEITLCAKGYAEANGKWLPPETVAAWKLAKEQDDPKIDALEQKALTARNAKDFDAARQACEDALSLIDSYPVKPHPKDKTIRNLLDDVKNASVATEMSAKGLVLYEGKWMTRTEQVRRENQAKGLVEYKGKWLSKSEAFVEEQTDKGLVFYDGKWMTPDQRLEAQGMVKFEGKWMPLKEKETVLAKRSEAARIEQERLAAEERKKEQAEQLCKDAYAKSQEYCRKVLNKAADSASFKPYNSGEVTVTLKDGWYTVTAPVRYLNDLGAMMDRTYYSNLRPVPGKPGSWEEKGKVFLTGN